MVDALPYGSWPSPISAADAAASAPRFEGAAFVGEEIWWGESIPAEAGRTAVRRRSASGDIENVLAAPWNARSRVHEYGGGSWAATTDGRLFFVEKSDQRVWTMTPGEEPTPLTSDEGDVRYGGLSWQHGTLLAVREQHDDSEVPLRSIVAIDPAGSGVTELAAGSDFVAQPALSADGGSLAWVAWNHPYMPWDRTEVRVTDVTGAEGPGAPIARSPRSATDSSSPDLSWAVIGGGESAALQPEWTGDGELVYIDDPTGRWNLWRTQPPTTFEPDPAPATPTEAVSPADADTGGPLWVLGARWYAPLEEGTIVAIRTNGDDELVAIAPDGQTRTLPVPTRSRTNIEAASGTRVLVSGAAEGVSGIWCIDLTGDDASDSVELVRGGTFDAGAEWIPAGRAVTFDGPHGPVHAFDYPPTHPTVTAPAGELPPYLVWVHGGPTAHVSGVADSKVAFFTSRGIGVLDVNYGGSTGYGRAYRERLRGEWGVVDVDDVAAAAEGLAHEKRADPARLAIEGGSAGGWTVLAALVATDVFAAGVSRYGVGDARALAADTHDFEARYLDGLIGPLPESEHVYIERSPLTRADRFRVPLLLLQGDEDAVVPPSQSEAIRDALAAQGVPHAYVLYEGEGHGFRRAETIVHALETELAFLGQVFGFATPGVPPIEL